MAWVTPITNWTTIQKYNFSDFNRVEGNTEYLKDLLLNIFGIPVSITTDETWDNTKLPYFDEFNRIEGNIKELKDNWSEPPLWVTPKTDWVTGPIVQGTNLTGNQFANRIEKDLQLLYTTINGTADYLLPCGTFKAGGDHIRQHFTRS